ncbi:signal peptidase II [Mediterraneibacter glycyrrhizinilyticus]|nr:signal peptidase II [Mediterraneibacter glycyrrhizinilyticus]MBM6854217.1 signal peptidase II [Mediterraneibacter glycyrrhizinilyticus]
MDKKRKIESCLAGTVFFIVLILIDQFTKYLAVTFLKDNGPFIIIDGVFQLRYLENRGAAFGMMQGKQYLFVAVAAVIVLLIAYFYQKMPMTKKYIPLRICAVLLCSGAIGNMIDRLKLNYVVDFFYFDLIDFPIFNVADCYVVVACIAFVFLILFYYKEDDDFAWISIN